MSSTLLAVAVLTANYGYYTLQGADRQWAFYVCSQVLIALCLLMLLPVASRSRLAPVGLFACWLGTVEALQAAGCGLMQWGSLRSSDLCVQEFGASFYAAIAAATVAAIIVLWRRNG